MLNCLEHVYSVTEALPMCDQQLPPTQRGLINLVPEREMAARDVLCGPSPLLLHENESLEEIFKHVTRGHGSECTRRMAEAMTSGSVNY